MEFYHFIATARPAPEYAEGFSLHLTFAHGNGGLETTEELMFDTEVGLAVAVGELPGLMVPVSAGDLDGKYVDVCWPIDKVKKYGLARLAGYSMTYTDHDGNIFDLIVGE